MHESAILKKDMMPTDTSRHVIQCMSTDTTLSAQNNTTDSIIYV